MVLLFQEGSCLRAPVKAGVCMGARVEAKPLDVALSGRSRHDCLPFMCVPEGSGCDQNKESGLFHSRGIFWLPKLLHHDSVSELTSEVEHAFPNLVS